MKKLLFVAVFFLLASAVINLIVILSTSDRIIDYDKLDNLTADLDSLDTIFDSDCILVLGAAVWGKDRPSFILEDRLITGVECFKHDLSNILLLSGDHGKKHYNEVSVMKDFNLKAGIQPSKIFLDHAGFSTYESCYRAKHIFCANKIVIVTQRYHLYRALYIAKSLGLEAYGVAADRRKLQGQLGRSLREYLARIKDFFLCFYQPLPTYLGEQYDVRTVSGELTQD